MNKTRGIGFANVGKIWLQLTNNAGQVGPDGTRADMVRHVNHIKGQGVGCGVNQQVMSMDKGEVGVASGIITLLDGRINSIGHGKSSLMNES